MMTTTEYTEYKASLRAFNIKLKNTAVTFTNKSDWMNWINDSISTTDFVDKVEFETMYDDMADKFSDLVKQNEDLFDYIANADADQIEVILIPGIVEVPDYPYTTSQTCLDDCIATCDAAIDDLVDEWNSNVAMAGYMAPEYALAQIMEADRRYDIKYIEIAMEFNSCAGMCD